MAKKIEDQVLDRKTKEKLKKELLETVNTEMKDEIIANIASEVRTSFDKEYKNSIKEDIRDELVNEVKEEVRKEYAKISRRKSFKIFRLYIYLLVLLMIIGYLLYLLYNNGGIDILDKYQIVKKEEVKNTTTLTTTKAGKDAAYYYDNYSYLVDRIKINNYELFNGNYDVMNISSNDRLIMAYNNLSRDKVKVEGMIYTVLDKDIYESYQELFGTTEGYQVNNFKVNNISYAYQESTHSYIAVLMEEESSEKVINDITLIEEDGGNLVFTCLVAVLKDDNIYKVDDINESIGTYDENKGLSLYKDKLSSVKYIFKQVDGEYYLSNIVAN